MRLEQKRGPYLNRAFFQKAYEEGTPVWSTLKEVEEAVLRFCQQLKKVEPQVRVLELGCGEGRLTLLMAQEGFKAVGLDYCLEPLRRSQEKAQGKASFVMADAFFLPFKDNLFHGAIDAGLFHHVRKRDWPRYLSNLLRVLKKGGFYYLFVFNTRDRHAPRGKRNWVYHKSHYDHFFSLKEVKTIFNPWFDLLSTTESRAKEHAFYHLQMRKR